MQRAHRFCGVLLLLLTLQAAFAQYGYYDTNYYDDYELYTAGYQYDPYDDDIDGYYFNPSTGYYDDVYGDYYFDDIEDLVSDCNLNEQGEVEIQGSSACDIKIEGADSAAEMLNGGLDGVYKVWSCQNGRPMYKREDSVEGEDRILWYSSRFRDWDINKGTEVLEDDIIMYGGSGGTETRPQGVSSTWAVVSEFGKEYQEGDAEYKQVPEIKVTCVDGTGAAATNFTVDDGSISVNLDTYSKRPLLTDDEIEARYRMIYQRAAARKAASAEASPEVNLGLVSVFVFVGLGIVFGLPFLVARNRKMKKDGTKGGFSISSLLQQSKKRGHAL